jgi:hypothetical protein
MKLVRPHRSASRELRDDWRQVAAWMDEVEKDIDDLETLGTDDPRRELRELR